MPHLSHPRRLLLLITAALLFALPGCGNESSAPSGSPSAQPSTAAPSGNAGATAASDEPTEPVTLSVARFDMPADADSSDLFTAEGAKYYDVRWAELAKRFNIKIMYRAYEYATRDDTLRQMLASGDAPGAMLSTLGAVECGKLLAQGLIRALPSGFEGNRPNIGANLEAVRRRDAYKDGEGRYFAIPRALEGAEPYTDNTLGLYYRKDLARRSGIAVKDTCTLDELYAMFEQVRNDNPGIGLYGTVWPSQMLGFSVAAAVPETARAFGFYLDGSTGKYAYAYQNAGIMDGIEAFKKFYDAGYLDRDFTERPPYEARARFTDGRLFACADSFDVPTVDRMLIDFKAANPETAPQDAVGFAWILDNGGNIVAEESGNSWSEWVFGEKLEDRALSRFLALYDYLLGPDGLPMAVPGDSGSMMPLISGALEDSRVCALDPAYSDAAKQTAAKYWNLRKSAANLTVLKFDAALDTFNGESWRKAAALKPDSAIARIVSETDADGVQAAWQAWLNENKAQITSIVDELNANTPGKQ